MGPGRVGELVAGARAVGEQVGDAECRGDVDRLAHPVLGDHAHQLGVALVHDGGG